MRQAGRFVAALAWIVAAAVPSEARVVKLVVEGKRPVADGVVYGAVGPYERLDGTVYFEVDPRDPLNAVIVNIDKAPRSAGGLVEFSAPFVIIKPVDMAKGNQKILYGINNRGNNIELPFQTLPARGNNAPPDAHDGFLFRMGYAFVDAGWAGDIATTTTPPRIGANLPVAQQPDGRPIVAPCRTQFPGPAPRGYSIPVKGNALFRS